MRQHNNLPCDPGLGCTFPNCNCMPPVERVYETNEMPDDKKTTLRIWFGVFSGLIINIAIIIMCVLWYYFKEMESYQKWFVFSAIMFVWSLFGFSRIKKMSKP